MQTILAGLVALLIARMIPQNRILVLYSSCCFDRMGTRLADYVVTGLRARGEYVELIDAKAIGLLILEHMYKRVRAKRRYEL